MHMQAHDVRLLDEAMLVLAALATKDALLPSGMVSYLAERLLPSFCASIPNWGYELGGMGLA